MPSVSDRRAVGARARAPALVLLQLPLPLVLLLQLQLPLPRVLVLLLPLPLSRQRLSPRSSSVHPVRVRAYWSVRVGKSSVSVPTNMT